MIKVSRVQLFFTFATKALKPSTWATKDWQQQLIRRFYGRQEGFVVVTLDADFHALLALAGLTGPSVIRIRIEGLRGENLARLLVTVLQVCSDDLLKGAMVSVTENGVRIKRLPV